MRQVPLIPVFCALTVSTTGLLSGIERDDGTSMRVTPSRKAIPVRPPSLLEAVRSGRSGILSLLLQAGADSDAGEEGWSGSLMLSLHGDWPYLHAREKREESAVHVAVLEGRTDVLAQLLTAGGSPTDKHPSGWNPLQLALQSGDQEAMKILLAHGADPRVKGAGERTSLDLALALESSPAELELLIKGGADPNQRGPDGRTAVQVLLAARDFERTGVLLRHGGKAGSALYNAVVEGDREIFGFLVGQGVRSEPGSKDPVLVAAVREGQAELVEHLLQAGIVQAAGLARRGREGQSALHLAVVMNRLDLCRLLLEAGADPNVSFSRPATGDFLARV
ncbi:MAG: ankyrin repeat domain-containing protein, partial [Roseibacillus sp.]|nr:ankyrin repeat domain-containing protein [Roseibacillus sp.]